MSIGGHTRLYGVLGHPVGHTRSPAMQNAAFQALGLDAAYVALPVAPERLAEALRGARALGFQGLNVTVPHKQRAAGLCARLDDSAAVCGAANTLVPAEGGEGWVGHNTDAPALRELLAAAGVGPGRRALLLGAGGAALAGAWALLALGAELTVAARRPEAAAALLDQVRPAFPAAPRRPPAAWDQLPARAAEAEVIVNATTVGLGGADAGLAGVRPRAGQVVADFVYGDTGLARAARAAGAVLVTGEQILVRQGALAFTLWTGQPAPEAVMAAALAAPHTPSAPCPSAT